jgi:tetratricopeptide (TPR) repeat protein
MPTHIDVLVGDYESCVKYNLQAILADERIMRVSPDTAGTESFYFGYIVHNFHMLVYGAILGGMESIAMEKAIELNNYLHEDVFVEHPDLTAYLESYAALDIHVMVRFGRWREILAIPCPRYPLLMLFRSASLHYARGLALANCGEIQMAIAEANIFDRLRLNPCADLRILHNNKVSNLLAVDAPMLRGEIAYFSGKYDEAFVLLRKAVELQDGLNYDEPWGKMQPLRHALGGLLCQQGHYEEAEQVFRVDLKFHPKNPWGLIGLITCLNGRLKVEEGGSCCSSASGDGTKINGREREDVQLEVQRLTDMLTEQRKSTWADPKQIQAPCACCTGSHERNLRAASTGSHSDSQGHECNSCSTI